MTQLPEVRWPDYYAPHTCPIHVRNELDMAASPDNVWAWLTRPTLWPGWYVNSTDVEILDGSDSCLKEGTRFRWKTFGVRIICTVLEYVPGECIAWDGKAFGVDVYHAWLLQPTSRGCYVLTEETQHGVLTRLAKLFMPGRMYKYHQVWLEELERKARAGLPPDAQ